MSFEAAEHDTRPTEPEAALAARVDHLEEVLRQELGRQRQRAERAEAQLRAFGRLDDHAEELVAAARREATRLLGAARREHEAATEFRLEAEKLLGQASRQAEVPVAPAPATSPPMPDPAAGLDRELLLALRDHLIDLGALQMAMTSETRRAVIRIIQASGQARGTAVLRPVPSTPASDPEHGFGPSRRNGSG